MPEIMEKCQCCCCCRVGVVEGAKRIGLAIGIFAVISIFNVLREFFAGKIAIGNVVSNIISSLTCAVICFLVYQGAKKNKPNYLLPYIIIFGIGLVLSVLTCVILFIVTLVSASLIQDWFNTEAQRQGQTQPMDISTFMIVMICVILFIVLPIIAMYVYFWYVVLNAYRVLKRDENLQLPANYQGVPMEPVGKM